MDRRNCRCPGARTDYLADQQSIRRITSLKKYNIYNYFRSGTFIDFLNDAAFEYLLQQSIEKDKVLERTTTGIHKDELVFTIADMALKKFGSQGQQKSFLIALKLAQYAYLQKYKGFKPLLLLDDIFDKLDDKRMHKLMEMVSHHDFGQIFITDTGKERVLAVFDKIEVPVTLFEVNDGAVNHA